ncbi:MAG TPA: hypothetical protein VKH42_09130 [Vicinamibacterales bacterium]|nr:hypothetical protein [Vicinamibacterales bacterium]
MIEAKAHHGDLQKEECGKAGNPPNPNGLKTDYLWRRIPTRDGLTDINDSFRRG